MRSFHRLVLIACGFTILVLSSLNVAAQPKEQRFKRITIDDGLSQSTVVAITQDSIGFLWFGTKDGLNLYDGYTFTVFKNENTDSNSIGGSNVRSLITDRDGNVWAGTRNGTLNKYSREEQKFIKYPLPSVPGEGRTLSSIDALLQDDQGFIWIGTVADGVFKLDPKTGDNTHFYYQKDNINSLPSNEITSLLFNPKGELWVGTLKDGIGIINLREAIITRLDSLSSPKLPDHRVYKMFLDKRGQTWIGHYQGGCVYNPETASMANVSLNPLQKQVPTFNAFAQTDERYLWIGVYRQGLMRLNLDTREFEHFLNNPYNLNSLSHDDIRALLIDKTGNLWVGTNGGGLNKLSATNNFNIYRHVPDDSTSLSSNSIRSILEDYKGNLYLGSYTGLMFIDKEHKTTQHYFASNKPTDLANLAVYCLLEDADKNIWIGLEGGGLQKFDTKTKLFSHYTDIPGDTTSLLSNQVLSLYIDSKNRFWVGSHSGLSLFNKETGKFKHVLKSPQLISGPYVRSIIEGEPGYLWLASDNGLIHFEIATNKAEYFAYLGGQSTNAQPIGINHIKKDNDSIYWLATQGSGLYKLSCNASKNGKGKFQFTCVCPSRQYSLLTIYGILDDGANSLWFSTDEGLYSYNKQTNKFKKFSRNDGLQSNEFNGNAFYKSKIDGRMYFGGVGGLTDFFPNKLQFNEAIPPVVLTGIKIFNKPYLWPQHISITKEIVLANNQNYLTIEFAALDYSAPEQNEYAYKLIGFDEDWIYSGSKREAAYTNLPPGEYVFNVRASNNDGRWNKEGTTLKIVISPSFWNTVWFKLLVVGLVGLILYLIFSMRLSGYKERQKLLEEQLKTQSQKLQLEKLKTEYAVTQALIEGQNQEQKRISEDLHDGLGQTLTAASLNLMALESSYKGDREVKTDEYLTNLQLLMNSAIQEVRNISHNLMPYLLAEEGLQAALDEMCHRAMKSSSLKINMQITGLDERIGDSNEINLYRIAQEVISNTQKHSGATNLVIRYMVGPDVITWVSEDDGIGFDPKYLQSNRSLGLGLKNIQVRVQLMKGKITVSTKPGKGVRIEIEIPRS
ncbi:sensor histidine kinase [soil metagenome]